MYQFVILIALAHFVTIDNNHSLRKKKKEGKKGRREGEGGGKRGKGRGAMKGSNNMRLQAKRRI